MKEQTLVLTNGTFHCHVQQLISSFCCIHLPICVQSYEFIGVSSQISDQGHVRYLDDESKW